MGPGVLPLVPACWDTIDKEYWPKANASLLLSVLESRLYCIPEQLLLLQLCMHLLDDTRAITPKSRATAGYFTMLAHT